MKIFTNISFNGFVFMVALLFVQSCKKDSTDFSKFDGYKPSPEIGIPLFNTRLTMKNILADSALKMSVDGAGLIHFAYRKESIFNYKIKDYN
jgi:hypothetical protein